MASRGRPSRGWAIARWPAAMLYAAVGFLYAFSALIAPWWGVLVLWTMWLALTTWVVASWQRRPWVVVVSPVVAYALWGAVVLMGDWLFGWTA